jgi:hypothetical protein
MPCQKIMNILNNDKLLKFESGTDITADLQYYIDNNEDIFLPAGNFIISSTIKIGSNKRIIGFGNQNTILRLADHVNTNMFTNADSALGNNDIRLENLIIDGNWKNQYKPDNETRVREPLKNSRQMIK